MDTKESCNTNSNDPESMKSRVFIGHLATDRLIRQDLQIVFEKYGEIDAISMQRGYAFVQYKNVTDALAAVDGESGSMLEGSIIDVKMAMDGKDKPNLFRNQPKHNTNNGYPGAAMNNYRSPSMRAQHFSPRGFAGYRGRNNPADHSGAGANYRSAGHKRNYNHGNTPFIDYYQSPVKQRRDTTDDTAVNLYVVGKEKVQSYSKNIEKRLLSASIQIRVINCDSESEIEDNITQARKDGIPFAVIVTEDNVLHHSMTINILHCNKQEYIMSMDMAIPKLIGDYNSYLRKLNSIRHPNCPTDEIADVFLALSKGRFVKNSKIDEIIEYLSQHKIVNDQQAAMVDIKREGDDDHHRLYIDSALKNDSSSECSLTSSANYSHLDCSSSRTTATATERNGNSYSAIKMEDNNDIDFTTDCSADNFIENTEGSEVF